MKELELLHLLQKKRGFFESILELSELEAELTLSEWISVLEQKKVLLSCIEEIDQELSPFRQQLANLSHEVTEELETLKIVIKQILHLDSQNQECRKRDLKG